MNRIEHCKQMIEQGKYLIDNSLGKEDLWLCKYLKTIGKTIQEAYEIWKPIYYQRYGNDTEDKDRKTISKQFLQFWKRCDNVILEQEIFQIFQNEIDYIKKLDIPLWKKQYALYLVAYFKMNKNKGIHEYYFPPACIKHKVYRPDRHASRNNSLNHIVKEMIDFGIIEYKENIISALDDGSKWKFKYFNIKLKSDMLTKVVFTYTNIEEVKENLFVLQPTKKCKICGNDFFINSKTKKDICDFCYRKERNFKKHKRDRNATISL